MLNKPAESISDCFAQNLRNIRKAKGLTQEGLAQACGLSLVFLQNLEAGRRWVSPTTITALANALKVGETDFFKPCKQTSTSQKQTQSHDHFGHLPEDIRSALINICKHPEWPWDLFRMMLAGFESERSSMKRSLKKSFPGKPLKPLR